MSKLQKERGVLHGRRCLDLVLAGLDESLSWDLDEYSPSDAVLQCPVSFFPLDLQAEGFVCHRDAGKDVGALAMSCRWSCVALSLSLSLSLSLCISFFLHECLSLFLSFCFIHGLLRDRYNIDIEEVGPYMNTRPLRSRSFSCAEAGQNKTYNIACKFTHVHVCTYMYEPRTRFLLPKDMEQSGGPRSLFCEIGNRLPVPLSLTQYDSSHPNAHLKRLVLLWGTPNVTRSSSREVTIRVPTFFCSLC